MKTASCLRRFWLAPAALVALAPWASAQPAKKPAVLFDFEARDAASAWEARGGLQFSVADVPAPPRGDGLLPGGRGAELRAAPKAAFVTRPGQVPRDWLGYDELTFWAHRSAAEAKRAEASALEVQLLEKDGVTRHWRRVDLKHEGWEKVSLPLRWFRHGDNRVPRWDRVERLQFLFRDEARVVLDAVAVQEGEAPRSAELSAKDLRAVAFPGEKPSAVKAVENDHVRLLSNATELDADKLAAHLGKVAEAVFKELPFLDKPAAPPDLIVFAARGQYQDFPPALAKKLNSNAAVPQAGGFTFHGVATSSWDPVQGTRRPVYTHEYVHALLSRTALLPNHGEWVQEGFANYFQLKFHPQANLADIVARGVKDPKQHLPLKVLANGKVIPTNRYWQAVTLVETLLAEEKYRKQLPGLFAAFQEAGSTDLGPHLGDVLKTDWDELERAWRRHCDKTYGAGK